MTKVFFDIETGPASNALDFKPEFTAPSNLRDPEKIAAAIAEKSREWEDKLALSAVTGRVLAIGVAIYGKTVVTFGDPDERVLLQEFWAHLAEISYQHADPRLCGWNICGFDLPFLQRRSWMHDIPTPEWVFPRGRLSNFHIDLMKVWCGENPLDRIKLDTVARWMGFGGKTDPEGGKNFAKLWQADQLAALDYLRRDVDLVRQIAERMRA